MITPMILKMFDVAICISLRCSVLHLPREGQSYGLFYVHYALFMLDQRFVITESCLADSSLRVQHRNQVDFTGLLSSHSCLERLLRFRQQPVRAKRYGLTRRARSS